MQGRAVAVVLSVLVVLTTPLCVRAADAPKPIGRITASFGQTALQANGKSRPGDLYSAINNEDRVQTDGGGVSILLASRVVLKMDAESAIRISETPGQTMVVLEHGTVHVYVGQRPTADAIVTVADANSRIECKQGVFLASYSDKAKEGYYACEHGSVSLLATNENKQVTLAAEKQIVVKNHQSSDVVDLDRVTFDQCEQYLERLDQITVAQGADTFRMRSRTLDTQTAIAQLAAAGWIDKAALAKNTQAAAAANTSENSTANSSDSSSSSNSNSKNSKSSNTSTLVNNSNSTPNNSSSTASNTTNNPSKTDPVASTPLVSADAPPAQNVPTVDVASNDNTGATSPPPVDLGKAGNGPKDHGSGKDGMTASFTTPPGANVPTVSTPPVTTPPVATVPPLTAPPVDISGVNPVVAPVTTTPPPTVDSPPPVALDVPVVSTPGASVPPVDMSGPGNGNANGNGHGHGKGGGDTVTLSVAPPPPSVTPPPPINIDPVVVNVTPNVQPPPIDVTPAPNGVPANMIPNVPVVTVPDVAKGGDNGGGKGDKLAKVDPSSVTPAPQPPVVVPVAPPPVSPPPTIASVPSVAPPPVDVQPKIDPPPVTPIAPPPSVLPPPTVAVAPGGDPGPPQTTPQTPIVTPPPVDPPAPAPPVVTVQPVTPPTTPDVNPTPQPPTGAPAPTPAPTNNPTPTPDPTVIPTPAQVQPAAPPPAVNDPTPAKRKGHKHGG